MDKMMMLLQAAGDYRLRCDAIRKIKERYKLDYRTILGLNYLVSNRLITKREYKKYSDASYYTLSHSVDLYFKGYAKLIPTKYFESDKFIEYTGIDNIPDYFVSFDEDIKEFTIKPQIRRIGKLAFCGCTSLEEIHYEGDNLTYIDDLAFKDCKKLSKASLPKNLTMMGEGVYAGCDKINGKEINITSSILVDMSALA